MHTTKWLQIQKPRNQMQSTETSPPKTIKHSINTQKLNTQKERKERTNNETIALMNER